MNWEIKERIGGCTIFQARNAEGKRCYSYGVDTAGVATEPSDSNVWYSLQAVRVMAKRHFVAKARVDHAQA
jgi:hypothetical protein